MKKKVYLLIASDSHMTKLYDKVVCVCDEEGLKNCIWEFLKRQGCGKIATKWQVSNIIEDKQLQSVYRDTDEDMYDFDTDSKIPELSLRIEEMDLNVVMPY